MRHTDARSCWKLSVTPAHSVPVSITSAARNNDGRLPIARDNGIQRNAPMPINRVGAETRMSTPNGAVFYS